MQARERLRPGTPVEWESQASGSVTRKHGTVVCFVPAGRDALRLANLPPEVPRSRCKFERVSDYDRYVVMVYAQTGGYQGTKRYKEPRYYAPRASVLERATEGALEA